MRRLPEKGLIVSCYLDSMCGVEREFIASVCHLPEVVALRIEGLDNIAYARRIAPERYIIGLVKFAVSGRTFITPESQFKNIVSAGADMIATECYYIADDYPVMWDINWDTANIKARHLRSDLVLSTTYYHKAFDKLQAWVGEFPNRINFEGGIETAEEIQRGFDLGADYVTIGKAINDPPTIIRNLIRGVSINAKI